MEEGGPEVAEVTLDKKSGAPPLSKESAKTEQTTTDNRAAVIQDLVPHSKVKDLLAAGDIETAKKQATAAADSLVRGGLDVNVVRALRVTVAAAVAAEDTREFAGHLVSGTDQFQNLPNSNRETAMEIVQGANTGLIRGGMSPEATNHLRELVASGIAGSSEKNEIVRHLTSDVEGLEDFSSAGIDQLNSEVKKAGKGMLHSGVSPETAQNMRVIIAASVVGSQ